MAIALNLAEIGTIQGALALAMNSADNLAAEAASMGDREALGGSHRAPAYHARASNYRTQSAEMHALFAKLVADHGDLRHLNRKD